MRIETPFTANYEIEVPHELPSSGVGVVYFPPVRPGEGCIYEASLMFAYAGQEPWYGVFAARSKREQGLTVSSTMPNPDLCCVSSLGTGYVLNVARPQEWHPIQLHPVLEETVVTEHRLLLVNSFTRILAYGQEGQKWRTEPLCSDQLKIVGARENWIECTGWDAAENAEISFSVDVSSGEARPFRTSA